MDQATERNRNYFSKEKLVLKLIGISLETNDSFAYKAYSYLILTAYSLYVVLDTVELFKHDFDRSTEFIAYQTAALIAWGKGVALLRNRVKFRQILDKLGRSPFTPDAKRGGDMETKLNNECLLITKIQTNVYLSCSSLSVISTIVMVVVVRLRSNDPNDWIFPYGPFTVLNVTYSPNYEISWVYQQISMFYLAAIFTIVDILLGAVLIHLCYQFKILQNNISKMTHLSYNQIIRNNSPLTNTKSVDVDVCTIPLQYLHETLKDVINYHLEIIKVAEEIEEVFNSVLLLAFLGTLNILCFSIFKASAERSFQSMKHLGEMFSAFLQVLMICYWGDQVTYESEKVGLAVYNSDFVGTDPKYLRDLAFIIRRSQNSIKLTAGKFTNINMPTFAWIIRTSYSVFMLLIRTNTDNQVKN